MMHIIYTNLTPLSKTQTKIMKFVDRWAREEKTPVPRAEVVKQMKKEEVGEPTTVNALNGLLNKGYLRRAIIISNKTYYVQLRRI